MARTKKLSPQAKRRALEKQEAAEAAAEGGIEGQAREQERIDEERILEVVQLSSDLLTAPEIASRVGLSDHYVRGRLEALRAAKLVTPIRDKWSAGAPLSERKPQGSILFGARRTPREQVEDLIRDRRMSWSELTSALPSLEPHQVRHGLDRIGADGLLSSTAKGFKLRKKRGKTSTPIGQSQPSLLEWRTGA